MSTTDKLNKLLQTKADIKLALINKGLNPSDVFSSYADNIAAIESGGGGGSTSGLDFTQIGYSSTPESLYEAMEYSKQIYDNWNPTNSLLGYLENKKIKWFPFVDTSNVKTITFLDSTLEVLPAITITSKVTSLNYCFGDCVSLASVDFSNWDTSNVTNMLYMFKSVNCNLDLSALNTSKVTSMRNMFSYFNGEELDLSTFDTSNVTNMSNMFYYSNVKSLNLLNWNTSSVTDMSSMFAYCRYLEELDISSFSFDKITSTTYLSSMFTFCSDLKRLIYPENYPYDLLTSGMFNYVKSLTYLGGSIYIKDNTFTSYTSLPSYDTLERLLFKNLGNVSSTQTSILFTGLKVWGTGSDEARQSLIDSLITYSYDRITNGLEAISISLSTNSKALLTEDEIAQMTAKGYTLA